MTRAPCFWALWTASVVLAGCTTDSAPGSGALSLGCHVDADCADAGTGYRCRDQRCAAPGSDAAAPGSTCGNAGGHCLIGVAACAARAAPAIDDCNPDLNPGGAFCCLDSGTTPGDSGMPRSCDGAAPILASSYDRSCTTDADCVAVGEGDGCLVCPLSCPSAAINRSAEAAYRADVSRTPVAAELPGATCFCPAAFGPCCVGGTCRADLACSGAPDSGATPPDAATTDAAPPCSIDPATRFSGSCAGGCPPGTVCAIQIGGVAGGGGEYCAPIPAACEATPTCECLGACVCGPGFGVPPRLQTCTDGVNGRIECDNGIR